MNQNGLTASTATGQCNIIWITIEISNIFLFKFLSQLHKVDGMRKWTVFWAHQAD